MARVLVQPTTDYAGSLPGSACENRATPTPALAPGAIPVILRPMLPLMLLRHAKSSWDDGSLEDFDRPLAPRGEAAAPRMGAYMAAHDLAPQLILCSPAVRTRQTLDLVLR